MAKQPTTRREKRLRVTTDVRWRVYCAGAYWAGISEVPAASISDAQLLELKTCKQLEVELVDVDVVDAPAEG